LRRTYTPVSGDLFGIDRYQCEIVVRFLLGHRVNIMPHESLASKSEERIFMACESVANDGRSASQMQDYVLSIFASAQYYHIPESYRSMSVWTLLDDAMTQISERSSYSASAAVGARRQLYIPSRIPGGLLNSVSSRTAHWSLLHNLHKSTCRDSQDVFFTFGWSERSLNQISEHLPLVILDARDRLLKSPLLDFETYTLGDTETVRRKKISDMISIWESSSSSRAFNHIYGTKHFEFTNFDESTTWSASAGEVLSLMCEIMNINIDVCAKNDIGLMFVMRKVNPNVVSSFHCDEYTQVGLINWRKYRTAITAGYGSVTIAARLLESAVHRSQPWFEAVRTKESADNEYQLIGVWMRCVYEIDYYSVDAYIPRGFEKEVVTNAWLV
jgi:hypothetical protein